MRNLRHTWQANSMISSALFNDVDGKHKFATLFPSENIDPASISHARENLLANHGLHSYPQTVNGQHALIVYGYDQPDELISALAIEKYAPGLSTVTEEFHKEDKVKQKASDVIDEWRHGALLKAAGVAGLIGHVFNYGTALTDPDGINKNRLAISSLYVLNSALYTAYGNGGGNLKESSVINDLHDSLLDEGIYIDKSLYQSLQNKRTDNRPSGEKLEEFIKKNVVPINEGIGAIVNVIMMREGGMFKSETYTQAPEEGKRNKIYYGLAGLASWIGSMAVVTIPEKNMEKQDPELQDSPLGKAYSWIQESPMRFMGGTNIINMLMISLDAADAYEKNKGKDDIKSRIQSVSPAGMALFYIAATALSTASFKSRADLGIEGFDELFTRVAEEAITITDLQERQIAVNAIGKVLSQHDELDKDITAAEISKVINQKITMLEESPWVDTSRANIVEFTKPSPPLGEAEQQLYNQLNEQTASMSDVEKQLRIQLNEIPVNGKANISDEPPMQQIDSNGASRDNLQEPQLALN